MKVIKVKDRYDGNSALVNANLFSRFEIVNADENKVNDTNKKMMIWFIDGKTFYSDNIFPKNESQYREEQFLNFLLSDDWDYFEL